MQRRQGHQRFEVRHERAVDQGGNQMCRSTVHDAMPDDRRSRQALALELSEGGLRGSSRIGARTRPGSQTLFREVGDPEQRELQRR